MTTYWASTNIPVSRFRIWLANITVPKKVWEAWRRRDGEQLKSMEILREQEKSAREQYQTAWVELQQRDSLHERNWLRSASAFSGIDLSYEASLYSRGEYENHALLIAKEAYKRGMGYREFLPFYQQYRGVTA